MCKICSLRSNSGRKRERARARETREGCLLLASLRSKRFRASLLRRLPSGAPFFLVPTTSKRLLRRLIFKGYNDLLPLALVDQLTQRSCRSTTRLKHGLIAWVKIYAKLYCLQRGHPLERLGIQWEDLMDRSWSVPTLSPSLKPLKSYTFMDFNFNVLAPQTISYRCKSFKYF